MNRDTRPTSLDPPLVRTGADAASVAAGRRWQGIPGIERTAGGRLFACWYSGGDGEGPDNYVLVVCSDDDGASWSPPVVCVAPEGAVRAFDPCLWVDPDSRLWLFWAQSEGWYDGRAGVWCSRADDPDAEAPVWTAPRRIANGIMMNKPTVRSNGEWLLPVALWSRHDVPRLPELSEEQRSSLVVSADRGATFDLRGGARVPCSSFDEHSIVELGDGRLRMLVRTFYGVGESTSDDGGFTWSRGRATRIEGPDSRFFVRRLRSGRLLLVNHVGFQGRSHLTALLSDDDGTTWTGGLLLDERSGVSYPDGFQADDGTIYVVYDHGRHAEREILFAVFTEADVELGRPAGPRTRLRQLVDRA